MEGSPNKDFLTDLPPFPDRIRKWWTVQEDTDLIVGSVKWGLGHYDQIRADPELCFLNEVGPPTPIFPYITEGGSSEPKVEVPPPMDLDGEGGNDKMDVEAKPNTNKSEEGDNKTSKMGTEEKEEEEKDENNDDDDDEKLTKDGKHKWPSNRDITKYIKRIYRHIVNCEKTRLRQQAKAEKKARQQEERDKKKALVNAEWSKRERTDLVRILSTFGIPVDEHGETDVELLRERAKLSRKTTENVRNFLNTFLSRCDQVIQDTLAASKAQVDAAAAKTAKMTVSFVTNATAAASPTLTAEPPGDQTKPEEPAKDKEKDVQMEDSKPDSQQTEEKPNTTDNNEGKTQQQQLPQPQPLLPPEQTPPPPQSPITTTPTPTLTPTYAAAAAAAGATTGTEGDTGVEQEAVTQLTKDIGYATCRRVIQRINMFKDLRKYLLSLSEEDLDIVLASTKRSQVMPKWWDSKLHDSSLIKGVVKHGFSKWDNIIEDPELNFYPIMVEYKKKKEEEEEEQKKLGSEGAADAVALTATDVKMEEKEGQETDLNIPESAQTAPAVKTEQKEEEEKTKAAVTTEVTSPTEGADGEKKPEVTLAQLIGFPRDIQLQHRLESLISLGKQAEFIIRRAKEKKTKKPRSSGGKAKRETKDEPTPADGAEAEAGGGTDKKKQPKKPRKKKTAEKDMLLDDAKSMGGLLTEEGKEEEGGGDKGKTTATSTRRGRKRKAPSGEGNEDGDGEYVAKRTSRKNTEEGAAEEGEGSSEKKKAPKRRSSRKRKPADVYSDDQGTEKPAKPKNNNNNTTEVDKALDGNAVTPTEPKCGENNGNAEEEQQQQQQQNNNGQEQQPTGEGETTTAPGEAAPPPAKKPRKKRTPKAPKPVSDPTDAQLPSAELVFKEGGTAEDNPPPQPKRKRHRRTKAEMELFRSGLNADANALDAGNPAGPAGEPKKQRKRRTKEGDGEKPARKKRKGADPIDPSDKLDIIGLTGTTNNAEPERPAGAGIPQVYITGQMGGQLASPQQMPSVMPLTLDMIGKLPLNVTAAAAAATATTTTPGCDLTIIKADNTQYVQGLHGQELPPVHSHHHHHHHKKHSEKKKKKKDDEGSEMADPQNHFQQMLQPGIPQVQPATYGGQVITCPPVHMQDGSLAGFYQGNTMKPIPSYSYGAASDAASSGEHEHKKERGRRNETRVIEFGRPLFAPRFYKNIVVYADGFRSERMHQSYKNPKTKCKYFLSIKAEGDHPTFTASCEDDPGNDIRSNVIEECFDVLNKRLMDASTLHGCAPKLVNRTRSDDFFGLTSKDVIEYNSKAALSLQGTGNPSLIEYMKSLHHYHQRCNGKANKHKQHQVQQEPQQQQQQQQPQPPPPQQQPQQQVQHSQAPVPMQASSLLQRLIPKIPQVQPQHQQLPQGMQGLSFVQSTMNTQIQSNLPPKAHQPQFSGQQMLPQQLTRVVQVKMYPVGARQEAPQPVQRQQPSYSYEPFRQNISVTQPQVPLQLTPPPSQQRQQEICSSENFKHMPMQFQHQIQQLQMPQQPLIHQHQLPQQQAQHALLSPMPCPDVLSSKAAADRTYQQLPSSQPQQNQQQAQQAIWNFNKLIDPHQQK